VPARLKQRAAVPLTAVVRMWRRGSSPMLQAPAFDLERERALRKAGAEEEAAAAESFCLE
jgi:hypothetical protein